MTLVLPFPKRCLLVLFGIFFLFPAALAGFATEASAGGGSGKTIVKVFGLPNPNSTLPSEVAELRVLEEFRKRRPDVELASATGLRVEGLGDEIGPLMMVAGGISPDILYVNFRKIDSYVRQGILHPLDAFIKKSQEGNPAWNDRLLPQILPVINRPGPDGKMHTYAIPTRYYVIGLYYNKILFQKAGLPDRAPRDWEEMVAFARKIAALGPSYKPVLLNSGQQASWNLMNFLWSTGGEAVVEVEPNEWRAAFDSDEAVTAFEFYYRLVEGERLAHRGSLDVLLGSAEAQKVGMVFGYIGDAVTLDPNVWAFGAVPMGPTGIRGAELNASMMGIFAGVKDPRVLEAAWAWIDFASSLEAQKIRTDTMVELGMTNQVNPVDLRRFGYENFLELGQPGLEEEFRLALVNGKPEPYGKNCSLVYLEMTYPLDRILLSEAIAKAWKAGDRETVRKEIKRILQKGVAETNERMLGLIAPEEMSKRRAVAWSVVAVIMVIFGLMVRTIFRAFSQNSQGTSRVRGSRWYVAWLLLVIPLVLAFTWSYLPILRGAYMALLDYQVMLKSTFVGIDNFANVLFDRRFWGSMLATLHYAFWMLTAGFVLPIVLAYFLHIVPRQKVLFRTIYYLPALLTGTAVFVLWKEFFGAHGLVNNFMALFGVEMHRAWPEDPRFAMLSCVIPGIWAGAGPGCLIYLAALKTIPEEQFEASEIDGAGFWAKTWHIVVPALLPLIGINFIGAVMGAFQSSQNILLMTAGGPNGLTEVAALRIFYEAFMFLQFGPATAMAWILGSILVGFSLIQLKRLSRMEFRGGGR